MFKKILNVGGVYKLNELTVGNEAEVLNIKSKNNLLLRRLFDLGITNGVAIKIKRIAPLGGAVSFQIRDYELALRDNELKNIVVRLIK